MPTEPKLKLVKPAEWYERLRKLHRDIYMDDSEFIESVDCLYVAYVGREFAGWGSYEVHEPDNAAYLNGCGVLPCFRGLGIQHSLLKKRFKHARFNGLELAYTYSAPDNIYSNNNLMRSGMRLWRPAHWMGESWPANGRPWLYWLKRL